MRQLVSRRICFHLCALGVFLICLEVSLQLRSPDLANRIFDDRWTGGHPADMTRLGRGLTRDDLLSIDAGAGVVLACGDSVTFGTGVASGSTWAAQLQGSLADRQVVCNTGLPATDLSQISLLLEGDLPSRRPRAVVVAITGNMVSLAWIRRDSLVSAPRNPYMDPRPLPAGPGAWKSFVVRQAKRLCLPNLLGDLVEVAGYAAGVAHHRIDPEAPYGAMLAHGWRQAGLDPAIADQAWHEFEAQLAVLRDDAHRLQTKLVVTYIPSRFAISHRIGDNLKFVPKARLSVDPSERCEAICARLGVEYADSRAALLHAREEARVLTGQFEPLYTSMDYTHLSPAGHQAIARAVVAALER
jgi:hypothetical protein